MISVENLLKNLKKNNINFFTGVPDSILKNLSSRLEKLPKKKHIIASNEGAATSIGIGHYLATKKIACIYLQNSGLSNAINPLISIASKEVYSIPLLLIIGWRGSPRANDEPQHKAKGKITKNDGYGGEPAPPHLEPHSFPAKSCVSSRHALTGVLD